MKLNGKQIQEAIMQLVQDYKFDAMNIVEIVKVGIKSAFKKDNPEYKKNNIVIDIDEDGEINIYKALNIVKEVENEDTEISLTDAKKETTDVEEWEELYIDITPEELSFTRIGVQAAAQTIKQHLKSIEKERFYEKFQDKQWELLKGKVTRSSESTVVLDIEWIPVLLPPEWQVPNRVYDVGDDIFVYLRQISRWQGGVVLDITQSSEDYIGAILKKIIPELEEWVTTIKKIARIPWKKTKVVVATEDENVDPVWVMIGQWWDRINIVLSLLEGEKIDYIEDKNDEEQLIRDALKPAVVEDVDMTSTPIKAKVPEDSKSLAIWKWATNIKLAGQLVWKKIDII